MKTPAVPKAVTGIEEHGGYHEEVRQIHALIMGDLVRVIARRNGAMFLFVQGSVISTYGNFGERDAVINLRLPNGSSEMLRPWTDSQDSVLILRKDTRLLKFSLNDSEANLLIDLLKRFPRSDVNRVSRVIKAQYVSQTKTEPTEPTQQAS